YKIVAIIINAVFACLFIACAVLAFFGETSVFAFLLCCIFSLVWTFVYNKFAHAHLLKQTKKYAYVYIAIAITIAAVTLLTLFKLPPEIVFVQFTEGTSLRDVFPWVIGVKCVCDCGVALGLGFFFL
ncbi:MAG: hypothetical protein K2I20_04580, partial [Clostridia bacterium]|nr:hypothetical protein [Clostridia bacterium]